MGVCTMFWARSVFRRWTRQTMGHQHPHSNLALTASTRSGSLRRGYNHIYQNKFCNKSPGAVNIFALQQKTPQGWSFCSPPGFNFGAFLCWRQEPTAICIVFFLIIDMLQNLTCCFHCFALAYSTAGETFEKEIILAHMDKHWNMKTTALYREPHQEAF